MHSDVGLGGKHFLPSRGCCGDVRCVKKKQTWCRETNQTSWEKWRPLAKTSRLWTSVECSVRLTKGVEATVYLSSLKLTRRGSEFCVSR